MAGPTPALLANSSLIILTLRMACTIGSRSFLMALNNVFKPTSAEFKSVAILFPLGSISRGIDIPFKDMSYRVHF